MPTTMMKELNIIIGGVGGQGVVLMSEILGNTAVRAGIKVRGSEVLGMAQRGGSVFSNIRLGADVYSPMTGDGKCDAMVALEPSEAIRYIRYLNTNSIVLLNERRIIPAVVSLGKSTYPSLDQILKELLDIGCEVITLDAVGLAEEAGNRQASNVVMLGALFGSGKIPIELGTVIECIRERVPAKAIDINLKAFDIGYKKVQAGRHP